MVTVLVEAARNLRPPGSKGQCDPLVVVRCGGKVKQCKALKRTNNPKWHFQAQMGNIDPHEFLLVEVGGNVWITTQDENCGHGVTFC